MSTKRIRRVLAALMSAVMAFSVGGGYILPEAVTVLADEADGSSHNYLNGICQDDDCEDKYEEPELLNGYYQISNAGNLYWFAEQVSSGNSLINAVLVNDIYVNDYDYTANDGSQSNITISSERGTDSKGDDWLDWTPIGNNNYNYRGTFNGGGYTVSGLYFSNSSTNYVGLFGYMTKGTVKNTGIENSYFYGKDYVGGICGISNSGNVSYCYNTGSINSSSSYTGGICGRNFNAAVNCCYNTGSVNSLYYTGGICGSNSSSGTIISCYNTGNVTGSNDYIGGICGYNYSSSTVSSCYNTGIVSGNYAGGICGGNDETVSICYYLSDTAAGGINSSDVSGSAEVKTAEEFSSGEVTYLLNGGDENGIWVQTIGIDSYPLFTASDSSSSKVAAVTSNGSAVYANVVTSGVELSTNESNELLGVIIDTNVYGGKGGEYLNSVGVVIEGTLYQLTNFYYTDADEQYAFFPVTRDSNSSGSVTVRGEATTSTTATADDSLLYFVTEATSGLTLTVDDSNKE